jgi:kumamolisin
MKNSLIVWAAWAAINSVLPAVADQEAPRQLPVLVPESAGISPLDRAVRSHTRLRVLEVPNAAASTTVQFNTPSMLRSLYRLPSTGGAGAIAIVDAYHYPTALSDFNAFSTHFGMPHEISTVAGASGNHTFQVVYAPGYQPQSGGNYIASWNMEAALDIEWAHAMAPGAKIYLVEAASDNTSDLDYAVQVAAQLTGVKEVSMSWGGSETSYETWSFDPLFTAPGVVYLASGGDSSDQMEYPAASPYVVSCGGTSVVRNSAGVVVSEKGWSDTGCGPSVYESRPSYQNGVASVVGAKRGVSDLSFDADPNTGVYVYDTTPVWGQTGWWILGGTSVASPSLAGVINLAASSGHGFAVSTAAEEARIYGNLGNTNAFRDVTSGSDGIYSSRIGYDFITGVGSPNGLSGK